MLSRRAQSPDRGRAFRVNDQSDTPKESRFRSVSEVHVVFRQGNQTLLLRRFQTGYMDGYYSLPAGHLEPGESYRTAAAREAMEEAGLKVSTPDLDLGLTMHRYEEEARLSLFFIARNWKGTPRNMEPHKCSDLAWYDPAEKTQEMVPYVGEALRLIACGQSYCEFGWNS